MEVSKQAQGCLSCGSELAGRFCSHCGEKAMKDQHRSLKHFFSEFIHVVTHADSKLLKSFKYLFTRPGFITNEHLSGRRKLYTPPISLFIIANLAYLLISPIDALNSRFGSQAGQLYAGTITKTIEKKKVERGWSDQQLESKYNLRSEKIAKLLLILMVVFLSAPLALIFYRKDRYYYDHLVLATEIMNFVIFIVLIIMPFLIFLLLHLIRMWASTSITFDPNDDISVITLLVLLTIYFSLATRMVYKERWVFIIPKSFLLVVGLFYAISLYRFVLFHLTMGFL
jgi:hypothetical protein